MSETKKQIGALGHTGIKEIDPDAIERFFLNTINGETVDPADAMQAAVMLWAIRRGVRGGDNMNKELRALLDTKKLSKGKFDFRPELVTMGSGAFEIVLRHVRDEKKFPLETAVDHFTWYVASKADVKTIKRWIEIIRPRAEEHLRQEARIKSYFGVDKNR